MKYRILGKTGWRVSVLGYGAAPLGGVFGPINEKDGVRAVRTAVDLGVNFIDTSPAYGAGKGDLVLGKALQEISREQFVLATKVGRYGPTEKDIDFSAAAVSRSVDESLRRLRVSHLDLVQVQDIEFGSLKQIVHETLPALQALKLQGKLRHVGITGLSLAALRQLLERAPMDSVQSHCHYCLIDTTLVQLVPFLKEHQTGIISAAPFGIGLLTPKGPPDWHPAPPEVRAACAKAVAHCRKKKLNLARLALQFAVANRDVTTTLVGTADPKKMKNNVKWIEQTLDNRQLADVLEILRPIQNKTWPDARADRMRA